MFRYQVTHARIAGKTIRGRSLCIWSFSISGTSLQKSFDKVLDMSPATFFSVKLLRNQIVSSMSSNFSLAISFPPSGLKIRAQDFKIVQCCFRGIHQPALFNNTWNYNMTLLNHIWGYITNHTGLHDYGFLAIHIAPLHATHPFLTCCYSSFLKRTSAYSVCLRRSWKLRHESKAFPWKRWLADFTLRLRFIITYVYKKPHRPPV